MDKERIRQAILDRLSLEFETDQATSKRTRTASNDAETKSEGKYDTRKTEENYLADNTQKRKKKDKGEKKEEWERERK